MEGFPRRRPRACAEIAVPFDDRQMTMHELDQICTGVLTQVTLHDLFPPANVVFVCAAGVNRSNLACAHFLVACCGMGADVAERLVRDGKGAAWPTLENASFLRFVNQLQPQA